MQRVFDFAAEHAMFSAGERIGLAVSGGADSVCLFHVMLALQARFAIALSVIHVDHRLRGAESLEDARFVEQLASDHGLPFHLERADVALQNGNLEENARRLRLSFFHRLREGGLVNKIATGHTRSDQAETVLFRFLRGTGTTGLTGILPATREGIVRPLLALKRSEIEAYLRKHGIVWREDSTNSSHRFTRNRIRHELIPLLERDYQPALVDQLAHLAELSRAEDLFWDQLTCRHYEEVSRAGQPVLDCRKLSELPPALARRVIRMALRHVKGDLHRIDYRHVEAILAMLRRHGGAGRLQVPGAEVVRSLDWVRFAPSPLAHDPSWTSVRLDIPGEAALPGGVRLRLRIVASERGYNSVEAGSPMGGEDRLDWDRIEGPLTVRCWLPGDAYRPAGARQAEKIKQMFQIARIPLWERGFWPIIETGQGIVWSRRFGPSAIHQATPASRRVLGVEEFHAE